MKNGAPIGLQPFWAIFRRTTPQKLEKALAKALLACDPIEDLKSVSSIHDAMEGLGLAFSNIVLLGSGSMHVGGACVCCEHSPDHSVSQVAEGLVLSQYFEGKPQSSKARFVCKVILTFTNVLTKFPSLSKTQHTPRWRKISSQLKASKFLMIPTLSPASTPKLSSSPRAFGVLCSTQLAQRIPIPLLC